MIRNAKYAILFIVLLLLVNTVVWGQYTTTFTGKVTDSGGQPLMGVNILIKGTSKGTATNIDGNYTITAPPGSTLLFRYLGYLPQEIAVGNEPTQNVVLKQDEKNLSEVVVTALGIRKEKKALGYAVSEIKGEELTQARSTNIANTLSGKVAGLNVTTTATGPAGSTRIILRGNTSIDKNRNNQPLIVVDGIPINNDNLGAATEYGGTDAGDGISSINPDDIASMTVLKGGSAGALYGSRASNGVILITTKSGAKRKGVGIEYSSNIVIDRPIVNSLDWQYEYGMGQNGLKPQTVGEARSGGLFSWGAKLDGSSVIQYDGKFRPYSAVKDNFKKFYKSGYTFTNSVAMSGGTDKFTYRFGATDMKNEAMLPNSGIRRDNLSLNISALLGKHLTLNVYAKYIRERTYNRPRVSDSPGNANYSLYLLPTSLSVQTLRESKLDPDGNEARWSDNQYTTNPWFAAYDFEQDDKKDRYINAAELRYDVLSWLYVKGRIGADMYNRTNKAITPNGTAYIPGGEINDQTRQSFYELNADVMVGMDKLVAKDWRVTAFAGANVMRSKNDKLYLRGATFNVPYYYDQSNLQTKTVLNDIFEKKINSVYASAEVGFRSFLYLTLTGRNDWFSTLPLNSNSIFYPSAGLSFVLSDVVTMPKWINYAKLRTSWARVGGDTDPYRLRLGYQVQNPMSLGTNTLPVADVKKSTDGNYIIPNPNLRPYTNDSYEAGLEARFFDNRLTVDFSYYNRKTNDDIVQASVSVATGYNAAFINVGKVSNKGVELMLTGTPVRNKNFTWDITPNFSYNRSEVIQLDGKLKSLKVADVRTFNVTIQQVPGEPFGVIMGYKFKRDEQGNILFNSAGKPLQGENTIFGTGVAPYTLGVTNSFSYKSFSLGVLVDARWGNKIYSGTNDYAYYYGLQKNTLEGREGGVKIKAQDPNDPSKYVDKTVSAQDYYQNIAFNIAEPFIYDGAFIKLRQVILTYNLSPEIMKKTPFTGASLSFVARNLWIIYKDIPNVDPESTYGNGAGQGAEVLGYPQARSYGLNLNVKF
ncbi:SusC/RagA family TonB-linked outer membrane protein [Chitinophaga nivalis]|uniref:SusC/RagA family TonB-linked outer membrane protein n=1 Tax=Chitinophaga nivalis TaxID=2991709 RepID=A0ABT3IFS1_9BACT|nr:SusC/RagA family TonB-linked outer membrane protein [Chitinophaga nivalis]MCW3467507.1 SusC/RagA family TonB-linked outer membrane protein [Chitinophaga nivalis]MCW3482801.1 SusC/RagA family TonB-linked outer membrane protein [Chitinophaga nivalis]